MSDLGSRCSTVSRNAAEPQAGTASTVRRFLLLEERGPWGVSAVPDSRLDPQVKRHLAQLEQRERVRPLLIRRPARSRREEGVQVFLADSQTGSLAGTVITDALALLDLDLAALPTAPGPIFAVCTHGRHDACCAERGRPFAAAMAAIEPARTWEVSHIGGDRFAANLLVLPGGWYYGRVEAVDAEALVEAHLDGRVLAERLRGRSSYGFAVQAAEIHLRRALGESREAAVRARRVTRDGDDRVVELTRDAEVWQVRVRPRRRSERQLTCRATVESTSIDWVLISAEVLGQAPGSGPTA